MTTLMRKLYSPRALDILFASLGIVCFVGLFRLTAVPIPPIEMPTNAFAKGASLAALVLASGLLSIYTTGIDQKIADDYVFQTLSKSALMGMMSFLFVVVLWNVLLEQNLGRVGARAMIAIPLACWSVSYFIVRIRGTGA